MAFQSLYRRYRPQRFGDLRGQDHVSVTLRNAVRDGRVTHAYLFSGPRGTGKTSTARILAKALNCTNPEEGEPCGTCSSCIDIAEGRSLDVVELDAASNRGVDAMRDLVSRAALGTPGRWKVYIIDEVHMLTSDGANTLLKTLEEPPSHVIFVLATTEAHKVLPTIRSRTQHFEFRLLSIDILSAHLRWVAADAGLDIPPEIIDLVAHRGAGSARDALSKLDQVAAAGGLEDVGPSTDEIVEALCERDAGRALTALAERVTHGHDPRHLVSELLEHLRQAFLATVAKGLVGLPDAEVARVQAQAGRLGLAATVRAMEVLGEVLVDMREALDARVLVEVALVRLCRPEVDTSQAALVERIERLERAQAGASPPSEGLGGPVTGAASRPTIIIPPASGETDPSKASIVERTDTSTSPADGARLALGAIRKATAESRPLTPATTSAPIVPAPPPPRVTATPAPTVGPPAGPSAAPFPRGAIPTREDLTLAWADSILSSLSQRARSRYRVGRFVDSPTSDRAAFALPTTIYRDRCVEVRTEVDAALGRHFGIAIPLDLVVESEIGHGSALPPTQSAHASDSGAEPDEPKAQPDDEESIDMDDLTDAPASGVTSPIDHVMQVFDGAIVVKE